MLPAPALVAAALLALIAVYRTYFSRRYNYPPGPKGKFLVGNLHDVPKEQRWRTYASWKKQYGTSPASSPHSQER
jgi:hypothetical protein